MYELAVGPIPEGFHIHHKCRTALCVNPNHLEAIDSEKHWKMHEDARTTRRGKLFCKHGHEFTEENTYVVKKSKGGLQRLCKECSRVHARKRYAKFKERNPPFTKLHCGKGHNLYGDNLYLYTDKKGRVFRHCNICRRASVEKYKEDHRDRYLEGRRKIRETKAKLRDERRANMVAEILKNKDTYDPAALAALLRTVTTSG